jgi:hypothetical protein
LGHRAPTRRVESLLAISASNGVVSLKVTLRGTRPPVWRRLLIPSTMTLAELHQAIQAAMGWEDCHLHAFDIAGRQYGDRHAVDDVADENRLTLNGLVKSGVARFAYTYDFGDNWEHTVVIEKRAPSLEPASYPTCVAGKRNCPPLSPRSAAANSSLSGRGNIDFTFTLRGVRQDGSDTVGASDGTTFARQRGCLQEGDYIVHYTCRNMDPFWCQ